MADTTNNESPAPEEQRELSAADIIEQKVARGEIHLSEMGWKMLAARRKIEQSGIPLLSREESERELAERRGG